MDTLTYKTNAGFVTGSLQTWLSVILEVMPSDLRAMIFEQVKQRESDKLILINPNGTTTTVLRAHKGTLNTHGAALGV